MNKNTLKPELDLLCRSLCKRVLNVSNYQGISSPDFNRISTFLIDYNQEFSSSRESLNKNLQNWFLGKNAPSQNKLEEIARSLGYADYPDFIKQNRQKIKASQVRQAIFANPFQKALIFSSLGLLIALVLPILSGWPIEPLPAVPSEGSELLASVIQAVVVILFYVFTRFSDFGGRDVIRKSAKESPFEVQQSMGQFFLGWKYLWLSFSFLYLWFCILYGTGIYTNTYAQSVSDIITMFSSLCFAYMFSVMDVESTNRKPTSIFYTYLVIFTIALSGSSVLSILDRYYDLWIIDGFGTYILGYTNVIVMLYFFGRLESHYLNVNRLVLLPLYTYAIIQIAYVLFFSSNMGEYSYEAAIIGMALILKGFLYFLIREWIKEGKIEAYFTKQHLRKTESA